MIQVEHLTKLYGAKTAIADVSFSVEKGEVLAFLGSELAQSVPSSLRQSRLR